MDLFTLNALETSKLTTKNYSTSFSVGVRLLGSKIRNPIYAIYGFVRFADEIVDTFHDHNKAQLLKEFRDQTFRSIGDGISTNPILHSFQWVVNEYNIDTELIHAFLDSMEMDLHQNIYTQAEYQKYIYGSAEVVGLMCLQVFYKKDRFKYETLKPYARKLGEAFQKINFLRDINSDLQERGRFYFPNVDLQNFDNQAKIEIERDIQHDFDEAYKGIRQLKPEARLGVYISYIYYLRLFNKIKKVSANQLFGKRYRVSNMGKIYLLMRGYFEHKWLQQVG